MEIYISAEGKKKVMPDMTKITFKVNSKNASYEKVINDGIKNRSELISSLVKLGFSEKDIKTNNYFITEEKRYNEKNKNYEVVNYLFNENCELKFKYDNELFNKIMLSVSKLESAPTCEMSFYVSNKRKYVDEILKDAYEDALYEGEILAKVAGKKIIECKKISFKPFDDNFVTNENLEFSPRVAKTLYSVDNNISLTPKEIEVTKTIYCLFIAD